MKKIEVCLDVVLQTLADNRDLICYYEVENQQAVLDGNKYVSKTYQKLFNDLELNNDEFIQLLNILKKNEYLDYIIEKGAGGVINYKLMSENITGTMLLVSTVGISDSSFFKPTNIKLTLKGKFFILNEGGFQGEENAKNAEKNRIKKQDDQIRLLTLFLAIGSIGVLIIEALRFLLDYFL